MSFETGTITSGRDWLENKFRPFMTGLGWVTNESTDSSNKIESPSGRSFVSISISSIDSATAFVMNCYSASSAGGPYNSMVSTIGSTSGLSYPMDYWLFGSGNYIYCVFRLGTKWIHSMAIGEADRKTMTANVGQFVLQNSAPNYDFDPYSVTNPQDYGYFTSAALYQSGQRNSVWDGSKFRWTGWNTVSSSWQNDSNKALDTVLAMDSELYKDAVSAAQSNAASVNVTFPFLLLGATNIRSSGADTATWDYVFYGEIPDMLLTSMSGLEDGVPITIGVDQWIPFGRNPGPTNPRIGYVYKVVP